jgi:hypothetical protein
METQIETTIPVEEEIQLLDPNTNPDCLDEHIELKKMNKNHELVSHLVKFGDIIYNSNNGAIYIKGKDRIFTVYDGSRENQIYIPYDISKYCKNILKRYDSILSEYRELDFYILVDMRTDDEYITTNYGNLNPDFKYVYSSCTLTGEPDQLFVCAKDYSRSTLKQNHIDELTVGGEKISHYLVS